MASKPGSPQIEHVVFLIKENHSFDNYFGLLSGVDGATMAHSANPPMKDPDHRHGAWLTRKTTALRKQFNAKDIPAYQAYARQFTICDNYFSEVAGPSTPNHLMLIAADSPTIVNPPGYRKSGGAPLYDIPSLPVNLEKVKLTWRNYGGYAFDMIKNLNGREKFPSRQFSKDASASSLPTISWVYAPHELSEHPPDPSDRGKMPVVGNVTHGMQWTVNQVNAVVAGGLWSKVVIFITWDDWGGWYDHVDPPNVEQWKHDAQHPERDGNTPAWDGTQFRLGSRVGCLVLAPHARRGYVSKVRHSHVSLLKFCENLFSLAPLTHRDSKADDMADCFDFSGPPAPPPAPKPGV